MNAQQMLARLVGFPTVSRDSNLELIEFVASYLESQGVQATVLRSPCGQKANLYATVGPAVAGGVVLSGHTDVVPVDDQAWDTDPFVLTERNDRLYGRGTCDMKAFYAIALAMIPQMTALQQPIHFALSYDEETGCLGAPALIEAIAEHLPPVRAVIVGEPTELNVVTAHKGILYFETQITGFEAHSSLQHIGVSAVMAAGRLINWLAERQKDNAQRAASLNPGGLAAADLLHQQSAFEPAYTTLHCGLIRGGTAQNITARQCHFVTDIRSLPEENPNRVLAEYRRYAEQEVLAEMRQIHPETDIKIHIHADVPAFSADDACGAVELARTLTGQNAVLAQPYAAEAGQFQQAGFPTVMCGPGSIEQAHQPNEYISVAQFEAGGRFIGRLIEQLSQ
ncbi:MAG: acetylornithine deacetylase [Pseudomonadales bacterium]